MYWTCLLNLCDRDGEFTKYMILATEDDGDNEVMKFLKFENVLVCSTRARYNIFTRHLNYNLRSNMSVASVPCGLMEDLLTLNLQGKKDVHFTGIDLDRNSLNLAADNAASKNLSDMCSFTHCNAWDLHHMEGKFDIVTSNGLNIYEPSDEKVTDLYKQFNLILKRGGVLVTSFIVPPKSASGESLWNVIDQANLNKSAALTSTIVGVAWSNYREEKITIKQFADAGFIDIVIEHESCNIFPTVIARKPY